MWMISWEPVTSTGRPIVTSLLYYYKYILYVALISWVIFIAFLFYEIVESWHGLCLIEIDTMTEDNVNVFFERNMWFTTSTHRQKLQKQSFVYDGTKAFAIIFLCNQQIPVIHMLSLIVLREGIYHNIINMSTVH